MIKNGKPEGFWKSFYVTGVMKSEGKRTNFLLDSIWVFFDQSGDTTEKINYLYGKKNGWYYKYKNDHSQGLYIDQKSFLRPIKKRVLHMFTIPMVKSARHSNTTTGKRKVCQKNMTKKET